MDRARGTFRLAALKEKILSLENDLSEMSKERDRFTRINEKYETARVSLNRKDAVIKVSLKL